MNYNNTNQGGRTPLSRKVKRVSDVNAMGYAPYDPNAVPYSNIEQQPSPQDYMQNYPPQDFSPPPPYMNQGFQPPNSNIGYGQNMQYIPRMETNSNQIFKPPPLVQDFALQYGQQLATAGTTMLQKEVGRYVPIGKLKYYFAVDTKYVLTKLLLLFFPFTHKNWSVRYEQDAPVQPRYEINAPDLYIPTMAYITYLLVAGFILGTQNRFTFEQIGIMSSSALAWCVVELCVYLVALHIAMIETNLRILDLLAFSGYKFVGMISGLLVGLFTGKVGYYACLAYASFALAFFLIRALKVQVLPESSPQTASYYGDPVPQSGNKRRLYFLLAVALIQPVLSWWLTFHLITDNVKKA